MPSAGCIADFSEIHLRLEDEDSKKKIPKTAEIKPIWTRCYYTGTDIQQTVVLYEGKKVKLSLCLTKHHTMNM
jgi:hypothetical protein